MRTTSDDDNTPVHAIHCMEVWGGMVEQVLGARVIADAVPDSIVAMPLEQVERYRISVAVAENTGIGDDLTGCPIAVCFETHRHTAFAGRGAACANARSGCQTCLAGRRNFDT